MFVNIISVLGVLVVFELGVRLFMLHNATFDERLLLSIAYQPSGFVSYLPVPGQVIYHEKAGKIDYERVKFRINQEGYRGNDLPFRKNDHEIRIAILGGSHVFDIESFDYQDNPGFPHLIERHFQAQGHNVRVINAGLPGNDTRYFPAKLLLSLRRYHPDIVIINSIWNDIKWIARATETTSFVQVAPQAIRKNPMLEEVNTLDRLLGSSSVYRKIRDSYWKHRLKLNRNQMTNYNPLYSKFSNV